MTDLHQNYFFPFSSIPRKYIIKLWHLTPKFTVRISINSSLSILSETNTYTSTDLETVKKVTSTFVTLCHSRPGVGTIKLSEKWGFLHVNLYVGSSSELWDCYTRQEPLFSRGLVTEEITLNVYCVVIWSFDFPTCLLVLRKYTSLLTWNGLIFLKD